MKACVSPSKVQFIAGDILFHLSCCWCGCSPLRVTLRPGCFFLVFVILSTHSEVQTSVGDKATKKTATPPEEDIKKQSSQQQTERAEERRVEIEHWVGDPTALNAICLHNTDLNPYPYPYMVYMVYLCLSWPESGNFQHFHAKQIRQMSNI